jgi:hypothetical protein
LSSKKLHRLVVLAKTPASFDVRHCALASALILSYQQVAAFLSVDKMFDGASTLQLVSWQAISRLQGPRQLKTPLKGVTILWCP